jgi:hypothetical protein
MKEDNKEKKFEKKVYEKPELIRHGKLTELVAGFVLTLYNIP